MKALNDIVEIDNTDGALLLPAIEWGDYGHEGEGNGSTMDEGMPNMEVYFDPFQKISELE
jgi:hypothetical protein